MKLSFLVMAIVGMAISGNGKEVHNVGDSACSKPCSDIDPGEHCDETTGKCVCGAPGSPSCIGTDKPYCYHGKCEACAHPNVYCVGKNLAGERKCVLHEFFCDDDWDCEDGTDEKSCTHHDTTGDVGCFGDHLWECEDKKECIDATLTCDGKEDCNDGSDELMKDCENAVPPTTMANLITVEKNSEKPEIPTTTAKQITFETNSGDFGVPNNDPVRPRMANATDNEDHDHDDHDGHDHGGSGAIQIGATLASAVAFFAVLVI